MVSTFANIRLRRHGSKHSRKNAYMQLRTLHRSAPLHAKFLYAPKTLQLCNLQPWRAKPLKISDGWRLQTSLQTLQPVAKRHWVCNPSRGGHKLSATLQLCNRVCNQLCNQLCNLGFSLNSIDFLPLFYYEVAKSQSFRTKLAKGVGNENGRRHKDATRTCGRRIICRMLCLISRVGKEMPPRICSRTGGGSQ